MSNDILAQPSAGETLFLYLGSSDVATSAVLVGKAGLLQRPVYYTSHSMSSAERAYPGLQKVILSLIMASRKLKYYFVNHPIRVLTKYPIRSILHKPNISGRLA